MQYVLYPPSPETLAALLEEGFRDGHRFLRKQGLAPCTQCLAVRSRVVRLYRNNGDASSGESSQDEEEDDVFDPAEKEPAQDFQGMDMMCGDKMECDDFAVSLLYSVSRNNANSRPNLSFRQKTTICRTG
jgi:hypothetical protein